MGFSLSQVLLNSVSNEDFCWFVLWVFFVCFNLRVFGFFLVLYKTIISGDLVEQFQLIRRLRSKDCKSKARPNNLAGAISGGFLVLVKLVSQLV